MKAKRSCKTSSKKRRLNIERNQKNVRIVIVGNAVNPFRNRHLGKAKTKVLSQPAAISLKTHVRDFLYVFYIWKLQNKHVVPFSQINIQHEWAYRARLPQVMTMLVAATDCAKVSYATVTVQLWLLLLMMLPCNCHWRYCYCTTVTYATVIVQLLLTFYIYIYVCNTEAYRLYLKHIYRVTLPSILRSSTVLMNLIWHISKQQKTSANFMIKCRNTEVFLANLASLARFPNYSFLALGQKVCTCTSGLLLQVHLVLHWPSNRLQIRTPWESTSNQESLEPSQHERAQLETYQMKRWHK